jgi:hypothetical protein
MQMFLSGRFFIIESKFMRHPQLNILALKRETGEQQRLSHLDETGRRTANHKLRRHNRGADTKHRTRIEVEFA